MVRFSDQRESDDKVTDGTDDKNEDRAINEDCGITFSEALAKYKVMLETIQGKISRQNLQTQDKKSSPLLKKEEIEQLRRQFNHVRGIGSDKPKDIQWSRIELCQDLLVSTELEDAAGYIFTLGFEEVIGVIQNLVMSIDDVLHSEDAV